ncbi:MAG: hypothetical protein CFH41_02221 [Alphaproteobacteria bacterium MarineAlpha11_Bin1]|nr:MAG: hypothetical protein CFH41_02221 [Alphaproteobacteria bacterium MarineAlpha11_Bin1]
MEKVIAIIFGIIGISMTWIVLKSVLLKVIWNRQINSKRDGMT